MADDYLVQAALGALSGFNETFGAYQKAKFEHQLKRQDAQQANADELALYQKKLPLGEQSKIRIEQAKPDTPTYLVDANGAVTGKVGGKVSRAPVAPQDKNQAKIDAAKPQVRSALRNALDEIDGVIADVDRISGSSGLGWATGMTSISSKIPGTSAKNVSADIQSLKAKSAFNKLSDLRKASPTGGALGQISDKEEEMLSNAISSLDQGQTTDNFKGSLTRLKQNALRSRERLLQGYNETYGEDFAQPQQSLVPQSASPAAPDGRGLLPQSASSMSGKTPGGRAFTVLP